MIKVSESFNGSGNNIKKILIGSGISIVITIIGLIIFASFLTYTSISESTIPTVTIIITIISILIGSSMCMSTVKKNGIVNGVLIGLIYIGFIYVLSSIIEGNFALELKSIIMIIGALLAGATGGIIGVNRKWVFYFKTLIFSYI